MAVERPEADAHFLTTLQFEQLSRQLNQGEEKNYVPPVWIPEAYYSTYGRFFPSFAPTLSVV